MSLVLKTAINKWKQTSLAAKLLLVVAIIGSLAVYSPDTTLSSATLRSVLVCIVYAATLLCLVVSIADRTKITSHVLPFIFYICLVFLDGNSGKFSLLLLLILTLFVLRPARDKRDLYNMYRIFLIISSGLGLVLYWGISLGLPIPSRVVPYYSLNYSSLISSHYLDYYIGHSCLQGLVYRFCGVFNEPGYLGTILALVLCVERMNFRKIGNIILLLCGVATFSMAFFVILFIYLVLLSLKRPVVLVLLLSFGIFIVYILPSLSLGPGFEALISRFTVTDGSLEGDNRSNEIVDKLFYQTLNSSDIVWGHGQGFTGKLRTSTSTFKSYIIDYGLGGFVLSFGSLFISALCYGKKNLYSLFFIFCFFVSVYQRPGIFSLPYLVVLYGGLDEIRYSVAERTGLRKVYV
jgi:hypothetical protein